VNKPVSKFAFQVHNLQRYTAGVAAAVVVVAAAAEEQEEQEEAVEVIFCRTYTTPWWGYAR
jgi:hypothetical protein